MQITLAALADWAATTDTGKLVIGGVFDTIRVRQLPSRHPMMTVALRMSAEPGEAPVHQVAVRLVDPDGEALIPELKGRVKIRGEAPSEGASMQFVLRLPNVELTQFGPHAIDIFVDGDHMESLPLRVRQLDAGREGGPSSEGSAPPDASGEATGDDTPDASPDQDETDDAD